MGNTLSANSEGNNSIIDNLIKSIDGESEGNDKNIVSKSNPENNSKGMFDGWFSSSEDLGEPIGSPKSSFFGDKWSCVKEYSHNFLLILFTIKNFETNLRKYKGETLTVEQGLLNTVNLSVSPWDPKILKILSNCINNAGPEYKNLMIDIYNVLNACNMFFGDICTYDMISSDTKLTRSKDLLNSLLKLDTLLTKLLHNTFPPIPITEETYAKCILETRQNQPQIDKVVDLIQNQPDKLNDYISQNKNKLSIPE